MAAVLTFGLPVRLISILSPWLVLTTTYVNCPRYGSLANGMFIHVSRSFGAVIAGGVERRRWPDVTVFVEALVENRRYRCRLKGAALATSMPQPSFAACLRSPVRSGSQFTRTWWLYLNQSVVYRLKVKVLCYILVSIR